MPTPGFISKVGTVGITALVATVAILGASYVLREYVYTESVDALLESVIDDKNSAAEENDLPAIMLKGLKEQSVLAFSRVGETDFIWKIDGENEIRELMVEGKGVSVTAAPATDWTTGEYFAGKDFLADADNTAVGTVGSLYGYRRGRLVCLVSEVVSGFDVNDPEAVPAESDRKDIEIQCGELDPAAVPELSKEGSIKKLVANEYNVTVADVSLTISGETDTYVRGLVQIGEPGPGSNAAILAVLEGSEWRLVYSGAAPIPCSAFRGDDFPLTLSTDCADDAERPGFMPEAEAKVRAALAERLGLGTTTLLLRFDRQTDDHMRGTWRLEPGDELIPFLAYRKAAEWPVAFDGRGSLDCAMIVRFGFPADMIEECVAKME